MTETPSTPHYASAEGQVPGTRQRQSARNATHGPRGKRQSIAANSDASSQPARSSNSKPHQPSRFHGDPPQHRMLANEPDRDHPTRGLSAMGGIGPEPAPVFVMNPGGGVKGKGKPARTGKPSSTGTSTTGNSHSSSHTHAASSAAAFGPSNAATTVPELAPTSFIALNSDQLVERPGGPDPFETVLDWIERSLRQFAEVTVLAIEPWLACTVTVIVLSCERQIAVLQEMGTSSMEEAPGEHSACIHCTLTRGPQLQLSKTKRPMPPQTPEPSTPSATAPPSTSAVFVPNWGRS